MNQYVYENENGFRTHGNVHDDVHDDVHPFIFNYNKYNYYLISKLFICTTECRICPIEILQSNPTLAVINITVGFILSSC